MDSLLRPSRQRPIIRVFVSSTFSDFKFERDTLQRLSFPSLELHCQQNGFQFQAIDLRWGVSSEAGLDQRTMQICFNELRRSQEVSPLPNFLVLLGNRYGWQPLPERISCGQFQILEKTASQMTGDNLCSVPPVEVLRNWYRRDNNNVPPVYLLQSLIGTEFEHDPQHWQSVERILRSIVDNSFPADLMGAARFHSLPTPESIRFQGPPMPEIVRFQGSATEQEIWGGALSIERPEAHVLACFRDIENVDEVELAIASGQRTARGAGDFISMVDGRIDSQRRAWQEQLKQEIGHRLESKESQFHIAGARLGWQRRAALDANADSTWGLDQSTSYQTSVHQMCDWVTSRLRTIIDQQIREWRTPQSVTYATSRDLEIEASDHARFCQSLANNFVGRDEPGGPLDGICQYVAGESRTPYVVHGISGSGKSALLARAFQKLRKGGLLQSDQGLIRFLGITPRTSELRSTLINLCTELQKYLNARLAAIPTEVHELQQEFRNLLVLASAERPVVLFLDALDQLSDSEGALQLHWLPGGESDPLPDHVRIVVSCLSNLDNHDPAAQPYLQLQKRGLIQPQNLLGPLTPDEAEEVLFDRWMLQSGRTLSCQAVDRPSQRKLVLDHLAAGDCRRYPLYMKLLFEEVRRWHSWESPEFPGGSVEALLDKLVERLCERANHGSLLVERALGYLSASRIGLSETELLETLFADAEFKSQLDLESQRNQHVLPSDPPRIPVAIWARLRAELDPYLTERSVPGASVLAFYHRQIASWMRARFLTESTWRPHARLAKYFRCKADPQQDLSWRGTSRAQQELPYHFWKAGDFDELFMLSRDLAFWNAQLISSPADPQIALQTLLFSVVGSLSAGHMDHAAEFALTYSKRLQLLDDESPLTSLDQHSLRRALAMSNLRPPGESILWHLLIAWKLKDLGRDAELQWVLTQLRERPAVRLPNSVVPHARLSVSQVPEVFVEPYSYLANQWFGEDIQLCEFLAREGYASSAVTIASRFPTRLRQGQAYLAIAKLQRQLQSPDVPQTLALAVHAFAESEPKREAGIVEVVEIAGIQRSMGDETNAFESLRLAARLAEQIPYSAPQVLALSEIAKAEANFGNIDEAFCIWTKAVESATQAGDPAVAVQLLVLVARTLAEAEQFEDSQFSFQWALRLAIAAPQPAISSATIDRWLNETSHYFKPLTNPDDGNPLAIHILLGQLRLGDYEAAQQTAKAMPDPLLVSLFFTHIAAELQNEELWAESAQVLDEIRQLALSLPELNDATGPATHSVRTVLLHYMAIAESRLLQRYVTAQLQHGNFDVAKEWVGHIHWTIARAETLATCIAAFAGHGRREEALPFLSELEQYASAEQPVIMSNLLWEALALSYAALGNHDQAIAASRRNQSGSGHLKTVGDIAALIVADDDSELLTKLLSEFAQTELSGIEGVLQSSAEDYATGIRAIKLAELGEADEARRLIDDIPEVSKREQFRKWLAATHLDTGQLLDAFATLGAVVGGANYVGNPDAFHQKYFRVVRTAYPEWDRLEKFSELFFSLCEGRQQDAVRTCLAWQFLDAPAEWSANALFQRLKELGEHQTRSTQLENANLSLHSARLQAERIVAKRTRASSIRQTVEAQVAAGQVSPALELMRANLTKPDDLDISLLCKIAKQQRSQGQEDPARETLRLACERLSHISRFNAEVAAREIGCCAVSLGEIQLARDILSEIQQGNYSDAQHEQFMLALSNWGSNRFSREVLGVGKPDELRKTGRLTPSGPETPAKDGKQSESCDILAAEIALHVGATQLDEAIELISLIGSKYQQQETISRIVRSISEKPTPDSLARLETLVEFVQAEYSERNSDIDSLWEHVAVGFAKLGDLDRSLLMIENIDSSLFQGITYSSIAALLEASAERLRAIELFRKAGELLSDSEVNSFWLEPVCLSLLRLGDHAGAVSLAKQLRPQSGEEPLARQARLIVKLADYAITNENQSLAAQLLELAHTTASAEGRNHEFARALSDLAVCEKRFGCQDRAIQLFDRALALAQKSHHPSSEFASIAAAQVQAGMARQGLDTFEMISDVRDEYAINILQGLLDTERDGELLQRIVPKCLGTPSQILDLCCMLARRFPDHAAAIVAHMDRICSAHA